MRNGGDPELWASLLAAIGEHCGEGEWKQYKKDGPWTWRAKRGARTIVYLTPEAGGILASFALGERAVESVREAGYGSLLEGAKRYPEGTALRIPVGKTEDFEAVLAVMRAKVAF